MCFKETNGFSPAGCKQRQISDTALRKGFQETIGNIRAVLREDILAECKALVSRAREHWFMSARAPHNHDVEACSSAGFGSCGNTDKADSSVMTVQEVPCRAAEHGVGFLFVLHS